jgi:hypothetical protein
LHVVLARRLLGKDRRTILGEKRSGTISIVFKMICASSSIPISLKTSTGSTAWTEGG